MWKLLYRLLGETRLVGWIANYTPIAASIINAGTYSDALQNDYTAAGVTAASLVAGSVASAAKNLSELNGSMQLEQEIQALHELSQERLQEGEDGDMTPLPLGLIGSPFHNSMYEDEEAGVVQRVPPAGQPYQILRGITHQAYLATNGYILSGIIGPIVAAILAYRLKHCNREKVPDSSAPECYDNIDVTLTGVIIAIMFIQLFNHSIIAHGLRDWRTSLESSMRQLNGYLTKKISSKIPEGIERIRDRFHDATKELFGNRLPQPTEPPALPPNIFQAFETLGAFIDTRTNELEQNMTARDSLAIRRQKQLSFLRDIHSWSQAYNAKIQQELAAAKDRNNHNLQTINNLQQARISLRETLETMREFVIQNRHMMQALVQESARTEWTELNAAQRSQRITERLAAPWQAQEQLRQRLRHLTSVAGGAEIASSTEAMVAELTAMIEVVKQHPSITPRPREASV